MFDVNEKPLLEEELEFIEFIEFMEFIDAFGCGVALTFPKDGFLVELNPCVLIYSMCGVVSGGRYRVMNYLSRASSRGGHLGFLGVPLIPKNFKFFLPTTTFLYVKSVK